MKQLRAFKKKLSAEKLQHKSDLLENIENNLRLISQSKSVSFEECYRLVYNYCIYFCESSIYHNGKYENTLKICQILDELNFTRTSDVDRVKGVLLYAWNKGTYIQFHPLYFN